MKLGCLPLPGSLIDKAAVTLSRAFAQYPLSILYRGSPPSVEDMQEFLRQSISTGQVYISSPEVESVAIWYGPEQQPKLPDQHSTLNSHSRAETRMKAFALFAESQRQFHLPVPHWYLMMVGVDPLYHGKGVAKALLKPVLDTADKDQKPCYLDTHNPVNVEIYKRLGFHVAEQTKVPGGELSHWSMIRTPEFIS